MSRLSRLIVDASANRMVVEDRRLRQILQPRNIDCQRSNEPLIVVTTQSKRQRANRKRRISNPLPRRPGGRRCGVVGQKHHVVTLAYSVLRHCISRRPVIQSNFLSRALQPSSLEVYKVGGLQTLDVKSQTLELSSARHDWAVLLLPVPFAAR